jgi:hypothetical protein
VQYVLLLYAREGAVTRIPRDRDAADERSRISFALAPPGSATTVRRRTGSTLICDGPAAEAHEPLLGLALIDAHNLDEAIAIAQDIPDAQWGAVEIRPVRESP